MPRLPRVALGGLVYHVLNRANGRMQLFESDGDYQAFEKVLEEAHEQVPMRTLSYSVMPNHWHLVLWPEADGDLSDFMQWLTLTHTQRWHYAHDTVGSGHLYQGRFRSFPVESDRHYLTVCRYVERNPLRAGLVSRAEEWRWGSLWRRLHGDAEQQQLLSNGPRVLPDGWEAMVNKPQLDQAEGGIRASIARDRPYGTVSWVSSTCRRLGLPLTVRGRGRPPTRG